MRRSQTGMFYQPYEGSCLRRWLVEASLSILAVQTCRIAISNIQSHIQESTM